MQRAGEVPGRVLVVLPYVEDGPVDGLRVDELGGLDCQPGGPPVVAVAGERAGESVVADGAGLAHHVADVLSRFEHDDERPIVGDEPAEPRR